MAKRKADGSRRLGSPGVLPVGHSRSLAMKRLSQKTGLTPEDLSLSKTGVILGFPLCPA